MSTSTIVAAGVILSLTLSPADVPNVPTAFPQTGYESVRISGEILVEGGGLLAGATIKTDALKGAMAAQFSGSREFTAKSGKNGEWSLLGVTRGLWVLEASAADHLPHVVIVPISMMQKPDPRPWETSLALLPVSAVPAAEGSAAKAVVEAAAKALSGDKEGALQTLQSVGASGLDANALCAAGDVALVLRQASLAKRFFEQAATASAASYRPPLGLASAAMLTFDTDTAVKAYAAARTNTKNSKLQRMLSAAIRDLQQLR